MAPLDFKHFTSADYKPGETDEVKYYAHKRKKHYHGNESKDIDELSMKKDKDLPNLKIPVKGKKGTSKYMRMKINKVNAPYTSDYKKAMNASVQSADRKPEKFVKPDGKVGIRMVRTDKEVIKKETIVDPRDLRGRPKKADPNPESKYGIKHPLHPANLAKKKTNEAMQVFRVGHKTMGGNVHAKDHDSAMAQLRKKGVKGDITLTHRGPASSMPKPKNIRRESIDNHPKVKAARKAHAAGTWDGNVDKEGEAVVHINGKPHTVTNKSKTKNLRKEIIVDPRDLRGRPKKADPNPESKYGIKHPLHPANLAKKKKMKEEVNEATWPRELPPEGYEDTDVDEALTLQQRMKKSRTMKRMKARIAVGRRRAAKKMANKDKLEKRANRQARNAIAKKLTRGIPKRELTFARKQEIEKRLDKPALKMRIKRLAKRMFKDVRKKEVARKKG